MKAATIDPLDLSELPSERYVVGALVAFPRCIPTARRLLRVHDFVDGQMGAIFDCITNDYVDGDIVPELVARKLRGHHAFRSEFDNPVSPAAILLELAMPENAPTDAHVEVECKRIADIARKREQLLICESWHDALRNGKSSNAARNLLRAELWEFDRHVSTDTLLSDAVSVAEFVRQDHRIEMLIPNVIPAGQGGTMSARSKSLKTTTAIDANVSMATATPFFGHWPVPEVVKCGILSAESGAATISETFRRIAASKGIDARDIRDCIISTRCPKLRSGEWLDEIRRFIDAHELRCLTIDPTYLAFSGMEQNTLLTSGEALSPITDIIKDTGCTVLFVHHNRKVTAAPYGCPTLEEITGSGFGEWSRFWLLLNRRREWDEEAGRHWLWFVAGGSAGFGSRKWLDVREGKPSDPGGRVWEVSVLSASEGETQEQDERARQQEAKAAEQLESDRQAVCRLLAKYPEGTSKTFIRDHSGVSGRRWPATFAAMLDAGDLLECEVTVGNKKTPQPGFRLNTTETF